MTKDKFTAQVIISLCANPNLKIRDTDIFCRNVCYIAEQMAIHAQNIISFDNLSTQREKRAESGEKPP